MKTKSEAIRILQYKHNTLKAWCTKNGFSTAQVNNLLNGFGTFGSGNYQAKHGSTPYKILTTIVNEGFRTQLIADGWDLSTMSRPHKTSIVFATVDDLGTYCMDATMDTDITVHVTAHESKTMCLLEQKFDWQISTATDFNMLQYAIELLHNNGYEEVTFVV